MQVFSKDLVNSALIPPTGQGMFEGAVSDNFDERIEQKIFHAEIVVDSTNVSAENESISAYTYDSGLQKMKLALIISKKLSKPIINL